MGSRVPETAPQTKALLFTSHQVPDASKLKQKECTKKGEEGEALIREREREREKERERERERERSEIKNKIKNERERETQQRTLRSIRKCEDRSMISEKADVEMEM